MMLISYFISFLSFGNNLCYPIDTGAVGTLYSPATLERVAVEVGAGEVSEDRARLLEFQIGP